MNKSAAIATRTSSRSPAETAERNRPSGHFIVEPKPPAGNADLDQFAKSG
jgi:hypothetical protein